MDAPLSPPDAPPETPAAPPQKNVATPPILDSQTGSTTGRFPAQPKSTASPRRSYVPSEWALHPPLRDERLKGLGVLADAACLRSLSPDCAAIRKEVFKDYALTETEKVWTEVRADTGMPSEFYGLSERDIRLKIGSKIAGENGFFILPGIGIDGQLWDMLNGVKKGCEMKRGINSDGRYDVVRVCPESAPAARARKYVIPSKD